MRTVVNHALRRFAVVRLDEAAQLLFAANFAGTSWAKASVEDIVVHADSSMRPFGVVVVDPAVDNVVELVAAKAHEMVQALADVRKHRPRFVQHQEPTMPRLRLRPGARP